MKGCDKKDTGCKGGDEGKEVRAGRRAEVIEISEWPEIAVVWVMTGGRDLQTQKAGTRHSFINSGAAKTERAKRAFGQTTRFGLEGESPTC